MIAAPLEFGLWLSFVIERLSLFPRPDRSYTNIRAKRDTLSWTLGQEEDDSPAPGKMITIGFVHVVSYPAIGPVSEALDGGRAWRGGPLTETNRRWVPMDTRDDREDEVSHVESLLDILFSSYCLCRGVSMRCLYSFSPKDGCSEAALAFRALPSPNMPESWMATIVILLMTSGHSSACFQGKYVNIMYIHGFCSAE